MPKGLSDKEERMWQQAKKYVAASKEKSTSDFADQDWALVQHIFQKMKKKYQSRLPGEYPKLESTEQQMFNLEDYNSRLEEAKDQFLSEAQEDKPISKEAKNVLANWDKFVKSAEALWKKEPNLKAKNWDKLLDKVEDELDEIWIP